MFYFNNEVIIIKKTLIYTLFETNTNRAYLKEGFNENDIFTKLHFRIISLRNPLFMVS